MKEVQCLTGRLIALSRFISKETNQHLLFFKILKSVKKFKWIKECKEAFIKLKEYLSTSSLLSKLVYDFFFTWQFQQ